MDDLQKSRPQSRAGFLALIESMRTLGQSVVPKVNGIALNVLGDFPIDNWATLQLAASSPVNTNEDDSLAALVAGLFGLVIELGGWTTDPPSAESELEDVDFAVEGAYSYHLVGRYERSPANRAIAIQLHGTRCLVCNFDFEESYGSSGAGFVEVHHVTPVSEMGGPAVIDPRTDLVPLCSNCHSMIHRARPAMHPDELRRTYTQAREILG